MTNIQRFNETITLRAADYFAILDAPMLEQLACYYEIVQVWNRRLRLFAPCAPEVFATRHVLESLAAQRFINSNAHLMDVGSGGGAPGIPLAIALPNAHATLFELAFKKSTFLREAGRACGLGERIKIINRRFEATETANEADAATKKSFVTCRAIERFAEILPQLVAWSPAPARLILFGGSAVENSLVQLERNRKLIVVERFLLPDSRERFIFVAEKT